MTPPAPARPPSRKKWSKKRESRHRFSLRVIFLVTVVVLRVLVKAAYRGG